MTVQNEFMENECFNTSNPASYQPNFHLHFDNYGYGNNNFKKRKPHLDKLMRHFEYVVNDLALANAGYQIYAVLLNTSSRSDALLFNQAESFGNVFPFSRADLSDQSTLTNQQLNAYIENLEGYKKLYGTAAEPFCLIYKSGIGNQL